jgi:hypothetical protein
MTQWHSLKFSTFFKEDKEGERQNIYTNHLKSYTYFYVCSRLFFYWNELRSIDMAQSFSLIPAQLIDYLVLKIVLDFFSENFFFT